MERYGTHSSEYINKANLIPDFFTNNNDYFLFISLIKSKISKIYNLKDEISITKNDINNMFKYNYLLDTNTFLNKTNRELFHIEDNDLFESFRLLCQFLKLPFNKVYLKTQLNELNKIILYFKIYYNRNRPFQSIYKLNINHSYEYINAKSSLSGSLPSGHAAGGYFIGCLIYMQFKSFFNTNKNALELLKNHSINIGNRRLMACVHYPIDNIASFILVNELVTNLDRDFENNNFFKNITIVL
jgi:hypothetical protein